MVPTFVQYILQHMAQTRARMDVTRKERLVLI